MPKYDNTQIANELIKTALGYGYYGSALYAAKDIPCLTTEERWVILRYLNGANRGTDHVELQHIACKISCE